MKSKKSKALNAVLWVIVAVVILIFMIPGIFFVGMIIESRMPFEPEGSRIVKEYSDGTKLYRNNEYEYFHSLYGNVGIHTFNGVRDGHSFIGTFDVDAYPEDWEEYQKYISTHEESSVNQQFDYTRNHSGIYFDRYAYSEKGYIATADYSQREDKIIYSIYDVNKKEDMLFNSMADLMDYAEKNELNLSGWFWNDDVEQTLLKKGEWSLVTCDDSYFDHLSSVRLGYIDMFTGQIDKYASCGKYIAFHMYIHGSGLGDEGVAERNAAVELDMSDDGIIERKFFLVPVFFDSYIVLNTESGNFEQFESKKDAEKYLKNFGEKPDWQKTEYTLNDK